MSDETKPLSPPDGTTAIVVKNKNGGGTSVRLKNEKGQFVKKPKARGSSKEINDHMRRLLTMVEADPTTGRITKGSRNHITKMTLNMARIAEYDGEDPKSKSAAVQAYTALMNRAYGMPNKSDEEREENKLSGVKFVLIQQPDIMHKELVDVEDRFKEPEKPAFIDAEFVTNEDSDAKKSS
jgi:hypothetical protein